MISAGSLVQVQSGPPSKREADFELPGGKTWERLFFEIHALSMERERALYIDDIQGQ